MKNVSFCGVAAPWPTPLFLAAMTAGAEVARKLRRLEDGFALAEMDGPGKRSWPFSAALTPAPIAATLLPLKTVVQLKKPYGKGTFSRVRHARYLGWEDAFEVEFEDGLCSLEAHATIRRSNRISPRAVPICVEVDADLGSHFTVTYDTGEVAEVSWSFIRELPPREARTGEGSS